MNNIYSCYLRLNVSAENLIQQATQGSKNDEFINFFVNKLKLTSDSRLSKKITPLESSDEKLSLLDEKLTFFSIDILDGLAI